MSGEELCHLEDHLVDETCSWLLLTGGEPSAADCVDTYTYNNKKGLLFMNGGANTAESKREDTGREVA